MSGGRRAVWAAAIAVCAALTLVATPAHGQEASADAVEVRAMLDPPTVVLGEPVRLLVRVEHDADQLITMARVDASVAVQLIEDARPSQTEAADGRRVTEYAYTIAAFELGRVDLGDSIVRALREDGSIIEVSVALPPLTIEATTAPDDETLRPLKPQRGVGGAPAAWQRDEAVAGGGGAVALLSLLVLVWWLLRSLRRWRGRRRAPPEASTWPLEEGARMRLDVLAGRGAPATAEAAGVYYREIASVVREYLEARGGFRATALTTSELEDRMIGEGVDRWQARLVVGLLERSDRAVYARRHPDRESADHDLTVAYEIVELGRARAQAAIGEDGEGVTLSDGEIRP